MSCSFFFIHINEALIFRTLVHINQTFDCKNECDKMPCSPQLNVNVYINIYSLQHEKKKVKRRKQLLHLNGNLIPNTVDT